MATPHPKSVEVPNPGYEHGTISVRGVIWFMVILVLFAGFVHVVIWVVWYMLDRTMVPATVAQSVTTPTVTLTPAPRLEPSPGEDQMPWQDLDHLRLQERSEFARRGWVDPRTGQIRIPEAIVKEVVALSAKPPTSRPTGARKGRP